MSAPLRGTVMVVGIVMSFIVLGCRPHGPTGPDAEGPTARADAAPGSLCAHAGGGSLPAPGRAAVGTVGRREAAWS